MRQNSSSLPRNWRKEWTTLRRATGPTAAGRTSPPLPIWFRSLFLFLWALGADAICLSSSARRVRYELIRACVVSSHSRLSVSSLRFEVLAGPDPAAVVRLRDASPSERSPVRGSRAGEKMTRR